MFETDFGRIGMLVCADGRMPEIARCLTLERRADHPRPHGVGERRRAAPQALTTTQIEYLMRTRAAENGVWVACADKFGVEAESIVYAGRSCFIDPRGEIVARSGPDEDAALVVRRARSWTREPPIVAPAGALRRARAADREPAGHADARRADRRRQTKNGASRSCR